MKIPKSYKNFKPGQIVEYNDALCEIDGKLIRGSEVLSHSGPHWIRDSHWIPAEVLAVYDGKTPKSSPIGCWQEGVLTVKVLDNSKVMTFGITMNQNVRTI
jgi:hypothetical protein